MNRGIILLYYHFDMKTDFSLYMVYVFIIPESYTITFYINGGFLLILVKTKKAKYRH